MELIPPPPEATELIASLPQLGHPAGDQLGRILAAIDWLHVPSGQRLFTEGEPVDGVYVLFRGRVRFVVESAAATLMAWDVDPIALFGEGALLTGVGRSRTAVTVRDSLLARIPPATFEEVMSSSSEVAVATARRVAMRTVFPGVEERGGRRAEDTISFVSPSVPTARLEPLRESSARAVGGSTHVVAFGSDRAGEVLEATRHSDRILVVVDASSPIDLGPLIDSATRGIDALAKPTIELVVFDDPDSDVGRSAAWNAPEGFSRRLRIRERDEADLRRIARHVSGRSIGLVLGGGGARGLAHIGVLRAMAELDIPIDSIGGSSMGAIIGGQRAMGWPWERVYEHNERVWANRRIQFEFSFPTVSLLSGRRSRTMFHETFGDRSIEDFDLPFFCTSVDLSAFRLAVHREGPAAQWICASASAPGLWPPVVDAVGHLHVDGGQLNNVPTDVLRASHDGPIIAVDVYARQAAMTVTPDSRPPIGVRHMFSRRSPRFPSIAEIFNRCALLGSLQHQEVARDFADVYLTPDLSEISFRAFDRIEEAVDIGYRAAVLALSGWTPAEPGGVSRTNHPDVAALAAASVLVAADRPAPSGKTLRVPKE